MQLQRLDEMLARRCWLAARYSEQLSRINWLVPPTVPEGSRHNFQSYMARLTSDAPVGRDELMQELLNRRNIHPPRHNGNTSRSPLP